MRGNVIIDGSFQLRHAGEHTSANSLVRDVPEESFDHIEPRRTRGCEVHMEAGMLGQPCQDLGVLVGSVTVDS